MIFKASAFEFFETIDSPDATCSFDLFDSGIAAYYGDETTTDFVTLCIFLLPI